MKLLNDRIEKLRDSFELKDDIWGYAIDTSFYVGLSRQELWKIYKNPRNSKKKRKAALWNIIWLCEFKSIRGYEPKRIVFPT